MSRTIISCHKCGDNLTLFDEDDFRDVNIDPISCEYPELICKNCEIYYAACPDCSDYGSAVLGNIVLMKFLGHELICPHNKKYYCAPESHGEDYDDEFESCEICIKRKGIFENGNNTVTIGASYIDQNVHYIDPKNVVNGSKNRITGDDGGLYNHWFCEHCEKVFSYTDK